ncbi:MAG: hypothetical protein AB2385_04510 [Symbiobacterium sp.]|uniref:hypothetical protein n=1 Tax=Symbiobacterium sp. TaxID=1971213 RepID=UPI0034649F5F
MESQEPVIYMPAEAGTAFAPDGRKLVFFSVPELDVMIKQVLAASPDQYTYRWGYHPGERLHVLLFGWPTGHGAGLAIPEGAGDAVLNFMLGTSDVYITSQPLGERLEGDASPEGIDRIRFGFTVYLPNVKFKPEAT